MWKYFCLKLAPKIALCIMAGLASSIVSTPEKVLPETFTYKKELLDLFTILPEKGVGYNHVRFLLLRTSLKYALMHGTDLYNQFLYEPMPRVADNMLRNAQINVARFFLNSLPHISCSPESAFLDTLNLLYLCESVDRRFDKFIKQPKPIKISPGNLPATSVSSLADYYGVLGHALTHFDRLTGRLTIKESIPGDQIAIKLCQKAWQELYKKSTGTPTAAHQKATKYFALASKL
jgi:hypothetical protein